MRNVTLMGASFLGMAVWSSARCDDVPAQRRDSIELQQTNAEAGQAVDDHRKAMERELIAAERALRERREFLANLQRKGMIADRVVELAADELPEGMTDDDWELAGTEILPVPKMQLRVLIQARIPDADSIAEAYVTIQKQREDTLHTIISDLLCDVGVSLAVERKLMLAGQGDIKRHLKEFAADQKGTPNNANTLSEIMRRERAQNPFHEGSLFHRMLQRELTPNQLAAYQTLDFLRNQSAVITYSAQDGVFWKDVRFGCRSVNSRIFQTACALSYVRSISFEDLRHPDAELERLSQLSQLESLEMRRARFGKSGLTPLVRLRQLRHLELDEASIPVDGYVDLAKLTGLQELELRGVAVPEGGLQYLARCPKLERLVLSDATFAAAELAKLALANCHHLTDLDLSRTAVDDDGFAQVGKCVGLTRLVLSGTPLNDSSVKHLTKLKNLTHLMVNHTGITDTGLSQLAGLAKLEYLDIGSNRISDTGLLSLTALTQLQTLNILNTNITDDGLSEFTRAVPDVKVRGK
jgi:hypothetical protein